jgi:hypothetical protein
LILETDECLFGIAGVLFCLRGGLKIPAYFVSQTMKESEKKYHITVLEALAFLYSIKKMRALILGKVFKVVTDQKPLTSLIGKKRKRDAESTVAKIEGWNVELEQFEFVVN